MEIREQYTRQQWGFRGALTQWIERAASTAPNKIGELYATVGLDSNVLARVDGHRGVAKGTTERELKEITNRRNRIAHAADRVGSRRAKLSYADARGAVVAIRSIGEALVAVTPPPRAG
jgi:hypothetical protein